MKISQTLSLLPSMHLTGKRSPVNETLRETNANFGESLKQAVSDVNSLQQAASQAMEHMIAGEAVDLHDVMISVEKAKTSFELLMEIRNKALDTYRELMRMQV